MTNPFRLIGGQVPGLLTVPAGVPVEGEEYGLPLSTQWRGDQQRVLVLTSHRRQAQMMSGEPAADDAGREARGLKHSCLAVDQSWSMVWYKNML